jgi:hypothetical protein
MHPEALYVTGAFAIFGVGFYIGGPKPKIELTKKFGGSRRVAITPAETRIRQWKQR